MKQSPKILLTAMLVSATSTLLAHEPPEPNILFIMADDHAWQAISAYGESRNLIQTPNHFADRAVPRSSPVPTATSMDFTTTTLVGSMVLKRPSPSCSERPATRLR